MDKTTVENSKTVIEPDTIGKSIEQTILDTESDITILENKADSVPATEKLEFQDYKTIKQFPTAGAEADIYVIEKDNKKYILKLYRHAMKPSKDMIDRLVEMSDKYTDDIVRIHEIDKDKKTGRWYEIQEYAEYGTLKDLMINDRDFAVKNISKIVEEMMLLLKTIHGENIIHRDIKPDNILIRTMEPLDLIITDFGISSVLDEEMSKKMTSKSGTRIYFAPESFSGVIGREVDYWALGMIILEIFEGGNVFRGINEGMIAHEIFTKGVKVPQNIDEHIQLLLKGLLTRDPSGRWDHKQIVKWLKGNTNIPTTYSYSNDGYSDIKPYSFNEKKFYDLKSLLVEMYTEENYDNTKEHIMRGYVTKWLEKNDMHEDAILIDKYKSSSENIDINIFTVFNNFTKPEKFIFMGKYITLQNLALFVGNIENKKASDIEITIGHNIQNKILLAAYEIYLADHKENIELNSLLKKSILVKRNTEIFYLLKIYLDKGLAYKVINSDNDNKRIKSGDIKELYFLLDEEKYVFPAKLLSDLDDKKANIELKNSYLLKSEINDFLKYKELFGLEEASYTTIVNDVNLYDSVQNIVGRSAQTEEFTQFADLFKRFQKLKTFEFSNQAEQLIQKEMNVKLFESMQPLSSSEIESLQKKIKQLEGEKLNTIMGMVFAGIIFIALAYVVYLIFANWEAIWNTIVTIFKYILGFIGLIVVLALFSGGGGRR